MSSSERRGDVGCESGVCFAKVDVSMTANR